MLSANREDILGNNLWNERLVQGVYSSFMICVESFNRENYLRYTWPQYLKRLGSAYGTIFEGFISNLVNDLRSQNVIYSMEGTLEAPHGLYFLPSRFSDCESQTSPLVVGEGGLTQFASPEYSCEDLSLLEISPLSETTFLRMLTDYINKDQSGFQAKSQHWQSRLALALLHMASSDLLHLRIIPLRDDGWITSREYPFYFPEISEDVKVPNGIDVATIDEIAASDTHRRQLFSKLGAQTLNSSHVFRLILDRHREHSTGYGTWTLDDVCSHARFLYAAESCPASYDLTSLRLASQDSDILHQARELYMDGDDTSVQMSKLYHGYGGNLRFIHQEYFRLGGAPFKTWLQCELRIPTLPKISDSNGYITPEFRWLLENKPYLDWMRLLRDHWNEYRNQVKEEGVRKVIGSTMVQCTDGNSKKLEELFLGTTELMSEPLSTSTIAFIAIEDSNDPRWLPFRYFGMHTELDLYFYATVLEKMPSLGVGHFTKEDIERLYSCLEMRAVGEEEGEVRYRLPTVILNSLTLTIIVSFSTKAILCMIMKKAPGCHSLSADGKLRHCSRRSLLWNVFIPDYKVSSCVFWEYVMPSWQTP